MAPQIPYEDEKAGGDIDETNIGDLVEIEEKPAAIKYANSLPDSAEPG